MNAEQRQQVYLKILSNFLIIIGFVFIIVSFGPFVYDNASYYFKKYMGQYYVLTGFGRKDNDMAQTPDSIFSSLVTTREINISPVNTEFSLVIEKIGLTAPIIANVSVSDEKVYLAALKEGIAHASVSSYPSDLPGNTYLFAHSSFDFWRFGKYAKAFNLLPKLENGDRVHVFYSDTVYVYEVINKEVLKGWDIHPLERKVVSPILTLQTCTPAGTTLNRLVITAKLIDVKPAK
jgi:LPXTG-site transpeptidase (sortase) family protein